MWHTIVGAWLSKAALPITGAALAVVLAMAAALWYTTTRLSQARDALAASRADTIQAVRANERAMVTIRELTDAARRNKQQRDEARRQQQAALARIAELEQTRREQTTDTIERVIRIANGDACAVARIPDRLRIAASRDADRDRNG